MAMGSSQGCLLLGSALSLHSVWPTPQNGERGNSGRPGGIWGLMELCESLMYSVGPPGIKKSLLWVQFLGFQLKCPRCTFSLLVGRVSLQPPPLRGVAPSDHTCLGWDLSPSAQLHLEVALVFVLYYLIFFFFTKLEMSEPGTP